MKAIQVGLLGIGTVGSGTWHADTLKTRPVVVAYRSELGQRVDDHRVDACSRSIGGWREYLSAATLRPPSSNSRCLSRRAPAPSAWSGDGDPVGSPVAQHGKPAGDAFLSIQELARRTGADVQELMTFYALEGLLARGAASRYRDDFVLKVVSRETRAPGPFAPCLLGVLGG